MAGKYAKQSKKLNLPVILGLIVASLLLLGIVGIFVMCKPNNPADTILSKDNTALQPTAAPQETELLETDSMQVFFTQYSINGINYSVPENWTIKSTTDKMTVFSIDDSEFNTAVVQSEVIPAIYKIAVGDNTVLDKESVAAHYGAHSSIDCTIEKQEWHNGSNYDFCNTIFKSNAKMQDGSQDLRSGRSAVIAINENEQVFAISILSTNTAHLSFVDSVLDSVIVSIEKIPVSVPTTEPVFVSKVESSYRDACSLTESKLTKKYNSFTEKTSYFYNGLIIQSEDVEWLKSSLDTGKVLNQGSLYRSVAKYLDGFAMGLNDGSDYALLLCGQPWKDKASFEPYVKNAAAFIVTAPQEQMKAIMKKFQTLSSATGEYDFNAGGLGEYTVFIPDLTVCAEEMQISEEMLGYIIALLDEYAPEISFENNSCWIAYGTASESMPRNATVSTTAASVVEECVSHAKQNLGDAYSGHTILDMENGGHILLMTFCYDGFRDACVAKNEDWKELTAATDSLSNTARNLFVKAGCADWSVSIVLLDDHDQSKVLYTSLNGTEFKE